MTATHKLVNTKVRKAGWPKLRVQLPYTRYVVDAFDHVVAFSTTPTDIRCPIVWSHCGQCSCSIIRCSCKGGVKPPRSIVHSLEQAGDLVATSKRHEDVVDRLARQTRDKPVVPPQVTKNPVVKRPVHTTEPVTDPTPRRIRIKPSVTSTGPIPDAQTQVVKASGTVKDSASSATDAAKRLIRRRTAK